MKNTIELYYLCYIFIEYTVGVGDYLDSLDTVM